MSQNLGKFKNLGIILAVAIVVIIAVVALRPAPQPAPVTPPPQAVTPAPAPVTPTPAPVTPAPAPVQAGWEPDSPVTLIVPFPPGGSNDMVARVIERYWYRYSPQPIVVVNKPGGGGITGASYIAASEPDGLTIGIGFGRGHDLVMPHIETIEGYDTLRDLIPVANIVAETIAIAVHADSPFETMQDVINWSKTENQTITAAVSTAAGTVDIAMRGLGLRAGLNLTTVPHPGGAPARVTLVGGHTTIGGAHPAELIPLANSGVIRILAVASPERVPVLPDVPTLIEQGIDFYTLGALMGITLPQNTPEEIVTFYEDLFGKLAEDEDFKERLNDLSLPLFYLNAEDTVQTFKDMFEQYGTLISDLGIVKQ